MLVPWIRSDHNPDPILPQAPAWLIQGAPRQRLRAFEAAVRMYFEMTDFGVEDMARSMENSHRRMRRARRVRRHRPMLSSQHLK